MLIAILPNKQEKVKTSLREKMQKQRQQKKRKKEKKDEVEGFVFFSGKDLEVMEKRGRKTKRKTRKIVHISSLLQAHYLWPFYQGMSESVVLISLFLCLSASPFFFLSFCLPLSLLSLSLYRTSNLCFNICEETFLALLHLECVGI